MICQLRTKKNDTDLFQRFLNALYDQSQIVIICLVAPKRDLASHFSLYTKYTAHRARITTYIVGTLWFHSSTRTNEFIFSKSVSPVKKFMRASPNSPFSFEVSDTSSKVIIFLPYTQIFGLLFKKNYFFAHAKALPVEGSNGFRYPKLGFQVEGTRNQPNNGLKASWTRLSFIFCQIFAVFDDSSKL